MHTFGENTGRLFAFRATTDNLTVSPFAPIAPGLPVLAEQVVSQWGHFLLGVTVWQ